MNSYKKIFFVGIGGIGVSAIARMMYGRGVSVSGSDTSESHVTELLRKLGIEVHIGQAIDLIPKDTDLVVYTAAILKYDPAFFEKLKGLGIPLMTYSEMLGAVSSGHRTVAVSGTHGKTTTTAMTAYALIKAGLDPTVVVGSLLDDKRGNFIGGESDIFVTEACEYNRSFLDLNPTVVVITNIEKDHLDYYQTLENIQSAFSELVEKIPEIGALICDPSLPNLAPVLAHATCKIIDYTKEDISDLVLQVPGEHNRRNAQAALSVAKFFGADEKKALTGLAKFPGTWRRFEYKGKHKSGALVYDDYAHHPTEIKATLSGTREKFPDEKIVLVFQPHLYSRTRDLFDDFTRSFSGADEVIIAPIYAAREAIDPDVTSKKLAQAAAQFHSNVKSMDSLESIADYLNKTLSPKTVLITMGAGDIYKVGDMLTRQD